MTCTFAVPASSQLRYGFSVIKFVFTSEVKGTLPGHSARTYWLFVMLSFVESEILISHPSPLLSRSCRTECAAWRSCTSQTLLLAAPWWTRLLLSGRPVWPEETAVSHSDAAYYWTSGCKHTAVMRTHRTGVDRRQQLESDRGRGHDPDDVIPRLTYKRRRRRRRWVS